MKPMEIIELEGYSKSKAASTSNELDVSAFDISSAFVRYKFRFRLMSSIFRRSCSRFRISSKVSGENGSNFTKKAGLSPARPRRTTAAPRKNSFDLKQNSERKCSEKAEITPRGEVTPLFANLRDFCLTFTKKVQFSCIFAERNQFEVRWKVLILAHPPMCQTLSSDTQGLTSSRLKWPTNTVIW